MPKEISAGAIIFYKEKGEILYLLLNYLSLGKTKREYWGFAKGHIEANENAARAARREIKEETGLNNVVFLRGFREIEKYFFVKKEKKIFKVVVFFLAEARTKKIKISSEHQGFKWLPYDGALKQLTFKNAKEILKKAHSFILEKAL